MKRFFLYTVAIMFCATKLSYGSAMPSKETKKLAESKKNEVLARKRATRFSISGGEAYQEVFAKANKAKISGFVIALQDRFESFNKQIVKDKESAVAQIEQREQQQADEILAVGSMFQQKKY